MLLFRARTSRVLAVGLLLGIAGAVRAQDSSEAGPKFVAPPVETHGFLEIYYRSGDPLVKDGYRVRKADLKFSGKVSPHLAWRIGFDAGKALTLNRSTGTKTDSAAIYDVSVDQRSKLLQDAALTYSVSKALSIDMGQQIVPLGLEATMATWNIETIERTNFAVERSRAVGLGDVRDIGVAANGQLADLEYHVGLFNEMGDAGGSPTDANDQKAVMARLVYHLPAVTHLQVGGAGGFEGGPANQEKQRAATEVQYHDTKATVRIETSAARDGTLRRFGWYGLGAYRIRPDLQLVTRYDWWDRDRTGESSLSNALEKQITGGVSYFIEGGNAKIALNLVRQTFPNITSVRDATFGLLAFQALF